MYALIQQIRETALTGIKRQITGRNALVKDLFEYLSKKMVPEQELLILCTGKGLILTCLTRLETEYLSGYSVPIGMFDSYRESLLFHNSLDGYVLISSGEKDGKSKVSQLQRNLKILLSIFDAGVHQEQYLLDCLDSVENAICIYDKNANLLYGNKSYLDNMHIFDKELAIGMNILDITKHSGIKIQSTKNGSNDLKMLDVLRRGNKILDWEVMIESQTSPNKAQFISNNMYPIKNKSGNVDGMIEIAYSHQLSLNKTKKIMGLTAEYTFDSIIGSSSVIKDVIEQAKKYAYSSYNLLIVGESGVGKELFAQSIHSCSNRHNEPFVALNCASFPENLIESELFGYVGGAFTGASKNGQIGKFELADGGTLFLDEIGELPYRFQSKLLRVLETRKISRIGSTNQTPVNVRVLAATNRDLEKMMSEGLFREDLYYRLQVLNIEIPPLRERREDILELTEFFIKQSADANDADPKSLSSDAQKCLIEYEWPGNIRELRNVIHRITLLAKTNVVTADILESAIYSKGYALRMKPDEAPEAILNKRMADISNSYANLLNEALDIAGGNKSKAANLLGISRKTFYRMLEKYC